MSSKNILFGCIILFVFLLIGCSSNNFIETTDVDIDSNSKLVVYVNSYHDGFEWSDDIQKGINETFSDEPIILYTYYMDTINNPDESFKLDSAKKANIFIESLKPDLIITSDDNAFKYLIGPYYKNSDIPVVFCGINWNVDSYIDMPFNNTAGMVEVVLIDKAIDQILPYVDGNEIGYLTFDRYSERSNAQNFKDELNINLVEEHFVTNYSQWKDSFLALQDSVDILILGLFEGIDNFNDTDAKMFIDSNVRIPIVVEHSWMIDYALISYSKIGEEQGIFAAKTALDILFNSIDVQDIPIVKNKEGDIFLNLHMADKLNISFSPNILRVAKTR